MHGFLCIATQGLWFQSENQSLNAHHAAVLMVGKQTMLNMAEFACSEPPLPIFWAFLKPH